MNPKEAITRCVEEFEARTQVELVVSIKKSSDSYFNYFWFYVLVLVQIFWMTTLFWNEELNIELLAIESLVLIAVCYLILMRLELLRYLVPARVKKSKFSKAVAREFYHLGMYNTKQRSGLLIMYSDWEDLCVLVPDKGVEERLSKDELATFTTDFQKAFKEKNLSDSVGSLIRSFGLFWKTRWPNEDDENEIVHSFKDDPV